MDPAIEELVALFSVVGLGLILGKVSVRGVSLGSSAVIFTALIAGHFGFRVPRSAGVVGLILFVYCLGVGAGPSFLRMFFRRGKPLAVMAVSMIISAGLAAWLMAKLLGIGPGLASGLFAGALTSTPALAAATEKLPLDETVAVGFGVAYPFGVIGVILFVQLVPRLLPSFTSINPSKDDPTKEAEIKRILITVTNPGVVGRRLRDVAVLAHANCQVSRYFADRAMHPIPSNFQLALGQQLLVVGSEDRHPEVLEVLGKCSPDVDYVLDLERQRRRVVVSSAEMIGRSLQELHLLTRFGVTVTRIGRHDVEFVPGPGERIHFGDAISAVGETDGLERFIAFAGHRERTLDETNLISLSFGLVLGVLLGRVEFSVANKAFALGLAGGPLIVGLLVGHIGSIGPIIGRMPRAARFLLTEIGLALFLAQAGSQAGGQFLSVLTTHGFALPLAASVIVVVPLAAGMAVSVWALKLGWLETSGGICGAMTSTPGLGAVTSNVESNVPAISYATVYPLALILITVLAPLLISQLS